MEMEKGKDVFNGIHRFYEGLKLTRRMRQKKSTFSIHRFYEGLKLKPREPGGNKI